MSDTVEERLERIEQALGLNSEMSRRAVLGATAATGIAAFATGRATAQTDPGYVGDFAVLRGPLSERPPAAGQDRYLYLTDDGRVYITTWSSDTWTKYGELGKRGGVWAGRDNGLTGSAQGTTEYVHPNVAMGPVGSQTDAELIVPSNLLVKKLAVVISSNTVDNDSFARIQKNGTDTAIEATIPANTTGQFYATGRVSFAQGDSTTVEIAAGGGATGDEIVLEKWAVEYTWPSG